MATIPSAPRLAGEFRKDVQGFRGLAISFVLLFHLWPNEIPFGFLGVDVFFVISGYLMLMILRQFDHFGPKEAARFCFRRVKRIVPLLLLVILVVLLSALFVLPPFEFGEIAADGRATLWFRANRMRKNEATYFDLASKYSFLLHLWSISVEMHFYAMVPLFFWSMRKLEQRWPRSFVLLVGFPLVGSLVYHAAINDDHMSTSGRLWEFMFGFLAFDLNRAPSKKARTKGGRLVDRPSASTLLDAVLFTGLFVCLLYGLFKSPEVTRLTVVLLTFTILVLPNENRLLRATPLNKLGDISFSIYLVHWPLLTFDRFVRMDAYKDEQEASFTGGLLLIGSSVLAGWLLESGFNRWTRKVNGWRSLLAVLFVGYAANLTAIHQFEQQSVDLLSGSPPSAEWKAEMRAEIAAVWANRKAWAAMPVRDVLDFNLRMQRFAMYSGGCEDESDSLPSHHRPNISFLQYICKDKGEGTKNFVLVGNSHAGINAHFGIKHAFRRHYKQLTTIGRDSCYPAGRQFQQKHLQSFLKDYCADFMLRELPLTLAQWKEPIDVLFVMIGFSRSEDVPLEGRMEDDLLFQQFQSFYGNLSRVAREVVFVQQSHPTFRSNPLRSVFGRLKFGQKLGTYSLSRYPQIGRRLAAVDCRAKCERMDWTSVWCPHGFCSPVDPKSGLLFFIDEHHLSPLGSLRQTEQMRAIYERRIKRSE